jgi:hypothetical protein
LGTFEDQVKRDRREIRKVGLREGCGY